MKADRSRDTFNEAKHYRRVLHQQGRVVLDADDNEQVSIDLAASETTLSDVIGPTGVPETSLSAGYTGGFALGIAASASSSSSAGSSSSSSSLLLLQLRLPQGIGSTSSSSSSSGALAANDLSIAHGRIYVDGILVINDQDTTLLTQPFLPLDFSDPDPMAAVGLNGAGLYAAYLDVWERVVTPIDDPAIQEIALGGPDTCLRSQIVWQVRLGRIDTAQYGANPACGQIGAPWPQISNAGLLTALVGAPSVDPLPCALPPESGYRSLENQLYRVEIHNPGGYGTATFKWSRENGSVVFGIVPAPGQATTGFVTGPTLNVTSTGRDASLGVKTGDWVELIDDRSEFLRGRGELLQVAGTDASHMTVTLMAAPSEPIDLSRHPKLRRWDQSVNTDADGIPVADGTPIDLENGIQIQFSNGQYAVGTYWLIPARTATARETVGTIEWPVDASGNYLPQPPRGIVHHYCKLGIVAYDGTSFVPPAGASAITDCRLFFPPLTAVQEQECPCTITLHPGINWTAQLADLFSGNNPAADAEICFAVGEFDTNQTVVIPSSGNVKVSGAGWGTRLVGQGLETVLRFQGCASVSVRDLSATATRVDGPVDATTARIGGALEFADCAEVSVDTVILACGSAVSSGAACLTVRNTITAGNAATGVGTVHITGSRFIVGQMQTGMLLVHVRNAFVENNEILTAPGKPISFLSSLTNARYRMLVERALIGGTSIAAAAPAVGPSPAAPARKLSARVKAARKTAAADVVSPATRAAETVVPASPGGSPGPAATPSAPSLRLLRVPNAGVTVGATTVSFNTPPQLKGVWQTYVDSAGPKEFASNQDLLNFVKRSATTLLTNAAAQRQFAGFRQLVQLFERNQVLVGRAGIVVGGRAVTELRVTNNVIDGFLQGVVVGVSHKETTPTLPADTAGTVAIRDNHIGVLIDTVLGHAAGRYGIFVGNVASLQIENNRVALTVAGGTLLRAEGICVFGYLGRKMIIRHNQVSGFPNVGINVSQVTSPGRYNTIAAPPSDTYLTSMRQGPQWLVADNTLDRVEAPVLAPSCLQINNTWM